MNNFSTQKGHVIIINTLLFFTLSIAIIFAVSTPVLSSFQITKSFLKSKQAFMVATSASNEAVYKLNTNKTLAGAETVSLAQGSATISVADTADGKQVSINSDVDSYQRNYEINVAISDGVSFNYGVQVGQGGFNMSGSSGIIGNVYSNGNVMGTGGAYVTGSAIAANISDPITVATNNSGVTDPPNQIDFGGDTTPQDGAQSFSINTAEPVSSVRLLIKKSGSAWMNNITMRITSDNNGKPSKTTLAQATISAATVSSSFGYLTVPLEAVVALTPGTTYWLVFDTATTAGQYYSLGANDAVYAGGSAKLGTWASGNGGTWNNTSPSTLDAYFDINVGGSTGLISGVSVGSAGVGDAWSYEVENSTIAGSLYCQAGTGNNKVCDNSRPNPVQQASSISDGNIEDWKSEAEAGGTIASVSLGSSDVLDIGPVKINGDLDVGAGAVLNLNGIVYVTGDISVSGSGVVQINPALGSQSVALVADGQITAGGGGQFQGSGDSNSYILLVTTSSCPGVGCANSPAIEITGGTGAVILVAQNGTLEFNGGAQAKQATADTIVMSGGATITYESGLQNPNFTSGPSGSWAIVSWKEVE